MIAVWGANGFIGKHVVNSLKDKNIKLFARNFNDFPFSLSGNNIKVFERDFINSNSYMDDIKDCKVAVLLVSASHARTFTDNLELEIKHNTKPYNQFLEDVSNTDNSLEHIIYVSSGGSIYGEASNLPIKEDFPVNPISPYGKGKQSIENTIIEFSKNSSWDYSILRVSNPTGKWSKNKGLANAVLNSAAKGNVLSVLGDGSAIRDYFAVEELSEAVLCCINNPEARNKIYNVGCGKGYSILDVIKIVEDVSCRKITVEKVNAPETDVLYNVLDCSKIYNEMGWKAIKDLKNIIQTMWNER